MFPEHILKAQTGTLSPSHIQAGMTQLLTQGTRTQGTAKKSSKQPSG